MVPFAGYDMPVSYPAGILAEHRQCREAAALFDVSHMGQLRLVGADAAAALETLVPVDIVGLAVGKQRYALFTERRRRHPRRPDGDAPRRPPLPRRQRRLQGRRHRPPARDDRRPLPHRADARPAPCSRCRDRPRRRSWPPRAGAGAAHLHDRRRRADRRHRLLRDALGLHRRGRLRDLGRRRRRRSPGPRPARRARGRARRPRRARHAAPGSGPVPLRPRDRHDDDAGRGRPDLGDPEGAPARRRARRRLSGRGDDRAPARRGRGDEARRPGRHRARAGARRRGDRRRRRRAIGRVTSGTIGPSVGKPVALAYVPTALAVPGTKLDAEVRGKRQPMQVAPLPFAPHRYFRG